MYRRRHGPLRIYTRQHHHVRSEFSFVFIAPLMGREGVGYDLPRDAYTWAGFCVLVSSYPLDLFYFFGAFRVISNQDGANIKGQRSGKHGDGGKEI
jgi:hypothetical protein